MVAHKPLPQQSRNDLTPGGRMQNAGTDLFSDGMRSFDE